MHFYWKNPLLCHLWSQAGLFWKYKILKWHYLFHLFSCNWKKCLDAA